MQITLTPDQQKFVDAQVRGGRFQSPEQVVAEALSRLMLEPEADLDNDTYAALRRSDEQLARGGARALEEVREELRAKYTGP